MLGCRGIGIPEKRRSPGPHPGGPVVLIDFASVRCSSGGQHVILISGQMTFSSNGCYHRSASSSLSSLLLPAHPPASSYRSLFFGSAMHSHPYGEGFGSYFESFFVFSQRCVCKCFSGDRVFRWPSCRGIDRAMSVGFSDRRSFSSKTLTGISASARSAAANLDR